MLFVAVGTFLLFSILHCLCSVLALRYLLGTELCLSTKRQNKLRFLCFRKTLLPVSQAVKRFPWSRSRKKRPLAKSANFEKNLPVSPLKRQIKMTIYLQSPYCIIKPHQMYSQSMVSCLPLSKFPKVLEQGGQDGNDIGKMTSTPFKTSCRLPWNSSVIHSINQANKKPHPSRARFSSWCWLHKCVRSQPGPCMYCPI